MKKRTPPPSQTVWQRFLGPYHGKRTRRFLTWLLGPYYDPGHPEYEADPIFFGGNLIAPEYLDPHTFICGTTGAGKGLTLRMLMKTALRKNGALNARAFLYDPQRELIRILPSLGIATSKVTNFDPCYTKGVRWKIADDINSLGKATSFTKTLFPDQRDSTPFFSDAARGLLLAVMLSFIAREIRDWQLFHVLYALQMDTEPLRRLINLGPEDGRAIANRFLKEDYKTARDIDSTVMTKILEYRPIANLWYHAKRERSIRQWASNTSEILVTTTREQFRSPFDAINRVLFDIVKQHVTDPEDLAQTHTHTWLFLDELREAGKIEGLHTLVNSSRKMNGHVVLILHSIDGLYEVYGENGANELAALCGNKVGLRVDDERTAKWLAGHFGKQAYWDVTYNDGDTSQPHLLGETRTSRHEGRSRRLSERYHIDEFEIRKFSKPATGGLEGVYLLPSCSLPWRYTIPQEALDYFAGEFNEEFRYPTRPAKCELSPTPDELTARDRQILGITDAGSTNFMTPDD